MEKDKKTLDATMLAPIEGHRIWASFRRFFPHQKKEGGAIGTFFAFYIWRITNRGLPWNGGDCLHHE
ncbi:hypothetical protein EDM59_02305 [Brevibacillus nitrificans]|uniref:Uncharacterized protein n=1 Tax=Brevibacillus nitrificans TaxID=651560 RepID=A0A3M8DIP3_9BACL|nr:hypothetical protein EDM59_02305 [Brevibacillus nitrificans]